MNLRVQRRLAASVMKCSEKRVIFQSESLSKIKEAITKADIRSLVKQNIISEHPVRGVSRARHRHRLAQKRKGRRQGHGSRKGVKTSRLPRKDIWVSRIRVQRRLLADLREKGTLSSENYRQLYRKAKGGFFRNRNHLTLYLEENGLIGGKNE